MFLFCDSGFLSFGTVARTIQTHYLRIVAFFRNRTTNAASESFNAKIKQFRVQLRGVRDTSFFLFRLNLCLNLQSLRISL
jgi:transposase